MHILLWLLQGVAALLFAASGVMKAFMFDKVSADVASFGALPRPVWRALGLMELVAVVLLIVPSTLRWHPSLSVLAAGVLAVETLLFCWVHVTYRETPALVMSAVLGLLMAFVAYGRGVLAPIV